MNSKIRIAEMRISIDAFIDDGEHLKKVQVSDIVIPGEEIDEMADGGLREALDKLTSD